MPLDREAWSLLRRTSRSLHLSLAALPRGVREPMGLGYLLCRAADTLADSRLLPKPERRAALEAFRRALGEDAGPPGLEVGRPAPEAERELILGLDRLLLLFRASPPEERALLREVAFEVIEGMRLDLERFPGDDERELRALETGPELERYCGQVGGGPGLFWTRVCRLRRPALAGLPGLEERGFRLGRGLQMVNLLRDLPRDLRLGRCYLPARELGDAGLTPRDLLEPAALPRLRPVLVRWLRWALEELSPGEAYVRAVPGLRLKAAAAWPLLLGLRTLRLVAASPDLLRPRSRVKVPRSRVALLLAGSPWLLGSEARFRRAFAAERDALAESLG